MSLSLSADVRSRLHHVSSAQSVAYCTTVNPRQSVSTETVTATKSSNVAVRVRPQITRNEHKEVEYLDQWESSLSFGAIYYEVESGSLLFQSFWRRILFCTLMIENCWIFFFLTDGCVSDHSERIRSIQIDKNFITQTFRINNFIIRRTVRNTVLTVLLMMKLYVRNVWLIKFLSIWIDLILSLWSETHSSVKKKIIKLLFFTTRSNTESSSFPFFDKERKAKGRRMIVGCTP